MSLIAVQSLNFRGAFLISSAKARAEALSLTSIQPTTWFWCPSPDHSTKVTAICCSGPAWIAPTISSLAKASA